MTTSKDAAMDRQIYMESRHIRAMARHLTGEEMDEVTNAVDDVMADGVIPEYMEPIARIMLFWILDSNGIDPYSPRFVGE